MSANFDQVQYTDQLLPFQLGTVARFRKAGTINFTAHSTALTPLELPRVGFLSTIIVQFRGVVDVGAAAAFADLGPWNLMARIRLLSNQGMANIFDLTGFGAFLVSNFFRYGSRMDRAGVGDTVPGVNYFAAPLVAGPNNWVLSWIIPVSCNDNTDFIVGLINKQTAETRLSLEIVTGAQLDAYTVAGTGVTAASSNFHIYEEYYETPPPESVQYPELIVHRLLEEQQPVFQTNQNIYTIPRQGILMGAYNYLRLDGARSDAWDSADVVFNKTDTIRQQERQWLKLYNTKTNGNEIPAGVWYHDFWRADGRPSAGSLRDCLAPERVATSELVVNITTGAVFGANNNFLNTIRRILQRAQPAA